MVHKGATSGFFRHDIEQCIKRGNPVIKIELRKTQVPKPALAMTCIYRDGSSQIRQYDAGELLSPERLDTEMQSIISSLAAIQDEKGWYLRTVSSGSRRQNIRKKLPTTFSDTVIIEAEQLGQVTSLDYSSNITQRC